MMEPNQYLPSLPPQPKVESRDLSTKDSDMLLNETMNRLSLKEREQVYEDVHGVSDLIEEETSFVNERLHQMEMEISNYCRSDNNSNSSSSSNNNISNSSSGGGVSYAYQLALSKNPQYCTNRRFRITFLRSVSFDAKAAAIRCVKFFQIKLDLFGIDKLVKPHICQSDLDPPDIKALDDGCFHVLPQRDSAGRTVGVGVPFINSFHSVQSNARILWYIVMKKIMDEETQKRGFVGIIWRTGKMATLGNLDTTWYNSKALESLPLRIVSMHLCLSKDPVIQAAMKTVLAYQRMTFRDDVRTRMRVHMGTEMECLYNLMSFGIPTKVMPFSRGSGGGAENGLKRHKEFLKCLKSFETKFLDNDDTTDGGGDASDTVASVVIVPGNNDILTMGRKTKTVQSFPGNVKFRSIIENYMEEYDRLHRNGRTEFSKMIVSEINQSGSKFLKYDAVGWVEMSDDEAKDKITHAFRNLRHSKKSTTTTSSSSSTTTSAADPNNYNTEQMMTVERSIFNDDETNKDEWLSSEPPSSEISSSILSQTVDYSEYRQHRSFFDGCKRRRLSDS